jgi:hypothetical protein
MKFFWCKNSKPCSLNFSIRKNRGNFGGSANMVTWSCELLYFTTMVMCYIHMKKIRTLGI